MMRAPLFFVTIMSSSATHCSDCFNHFEFALAFEFPSIASARGAQLPKPACAASQIRRSLEDNV